jgi:hypothetical protein
MHISSQGGSSIDENLEKIRRDQASLTTLSMELFLEQGDNFWVDRVRLTTSSPTRQLLHTVLTTCPHLAHLQLYSPRATSVDTIPLLAQCLTATAVPRLTSLAITRCVRLETTDDVLLFATAIRACRHLVDFKLVHPHCDATAVTIDPIVNALADLPLLQTLDITLFHGDTTTTITPTNTTSTSASSINVTNQSSSSSTTETAMTWVSPASLHKLLQSPRLTALSLWGCGIHDGHLQVLRDTTHHRLTFLSLRRNPQIRDWKPFYHSLLTNFCLKALYNDHADLMSCLHPSLPHHSPETDEMAAVCAAEICLALNRLGRGECCGEDDQVWLDIVAGVNESSMALYFLLRSQPDAWCERGRLSRARTGLAKQLAPS